MLYILYREACAIESAARQNPNQQVFLLYTAPVGFLNNSKIPAIDAIMTYKNVHLNNLNIIEYSKETPCEDWIKADEMYTTQWMTSHVLDYLKFMRYV